MLLGVFASEPAIEKELANVGSCMPPPQMLHSFSPICGTLCGSLCCKIIVLSSMPVPMAG